MQWLKSGIENPSMAEVIGRCSGMKKPNDHAEPTKVERSKYPKTIEPYFLLYNDNTVLEFHKNSCY